MVRTPSQYTFDLPHTTSYAPHDFVVTESNRDAHAVATRAVPWPAPVMAITGPAGSGKTHLAHLFAQHEGARFIDSGVLGMVLADTLLEGAKAFVLELPDILAAEEALAQLINAALAGQVPLLVTSRAPLSRRQVKRPDLSSRFKAIPEVALAAPDDTLLTVLLGKAFADRQVRAGEDVIAYLTKRIERSGSEVQRIAAYLDAGALAARQPLTVPFVRDRLNDLN